MIFHQLLLIYEMFLCQRSEYVTHTDHKETTINDKHKHPKHRQHDLMVQVSKHILYGNGDIIV